MTSSVSPPSLVAVSTARPVDPSALPFGSAAGEASPAGEGQYMLDVPDGWKQGRGAYGGLSIGALVRAIEHRVGDPSRLVRSVSATLPAPVASGPAAITVDLLRTGKNLTAARAALDQGGETRAHVVAILAASRPGHGPSGWRDYVAPVAAPWRQVEPLPFGPMWPEFAQHFEMRLVEGIPASAAGEARTIGWVRPRVPCLLQDAGYIASLADAWWPAALVKLTAMRPLATIAYTLDIVDGLAGLDPAAPLLYRGTVPVLSDGFFLETRELWGEDGRLVAINQQTFAVIA